MSDTGSDPGAGTGPQTHPDETPGWDDVDEESEESFPASDPPSHWSGSGPPRRAS